MYGLLGEVQKDGSSGAREYFRNAPPSLWSPRRRIQLVGMYSGVSGSTRWAGSEDAHLSNARGSFASKPEASPCRKAGKLQTGQIRCPARLYGVFEYWSNGIMVAIRNRHLRHGAWPWGMAMGHGRLHVDAGEWASYRWVVTWCVTWPAKVYRFILSYSFSLGTYATSDRERCRGPWE